MEVEGGSATQLDVTLNSSVVVLEAMEVTAELESGSAAALIEERRAASVVVNAIGSEQIARTPDSDAASALKRVRDWGRVPGEGESLEFHGLRIEVVQADPRRVYRVRLRKISEWKNPNTEG